MKRTQLRQQALQDRASLTLEEVSYYSQLIADFISQQENFVKAKIVMGFFPISQEVDVFPLLNKQFPEKTWLLPRVENQSQMSAVNFSDCQHTKMSSFGITEPTGAPFDPKLIDFVIVPGIAFDLQGYRLGYGRGYYDRFLPNLRKDCTICGVCFDLQILDNINPEPHDIPVDLVITEKRCIKLDHKK